MKKAKNSSNSILLNISTFVNRNKFILLLLATIFFLRLPFLFEPLTNTKEAIIFAAAKNLLPASTIFSFFDLITILFAKISLLFLGNSFWTLKFVLVFWFLFNLLILYFLIKNYFPKLLVLISLILLGILFSTPFLNFWPFSFASLFLLPVFSLLTWLIKNYFRLPPRFLFATFTLLIVSFYALSPPTYVKTTYYPSFLNYVENKLANKPDPEEAYYQSFGQDVLASSTLASYLKSKTRNGDKIYLFGNLTAVYSFSERSSASRYIEVKDALSHEDILIEDLKENKPKFLLISRDTPKFEQLDRLIKASYNLTAETENVIIYKLKDNKTN